VRVPAKAPSEEALYTAALNALTRRAHSVFEMRTYLQRRSEDADAVKSVLARLRQERLLDDGRYALEFARQRAQVRHQGRYRIARELRTRGVSDEAISAAVAQVCEPSDEAATVRQTIGRRMKLLRGPLDSRKTASLYRTLLRSGFDAGVVRRELAAVNAAAAAELPAQDATEEPT
jgi:regulatory protein